MSENVKKSDLVNAVSDYSKICGVNPKDFIDSYFQLLSENALNGIETFVPNIGKFQILHKNERMGRNPKNNEPHSVPARLRPKLKSSASFRELIKQHYLLGENNGEH